MMNHYYFKQGETKNALFDCLDAYNSVISIKKEVLDNNQRQIGYVHIYFKIGNESNKKYYTVVRDHGMRIVDYRINSASQPYTAIVLIEGKELNSLLSDLENAAHDDFITQDENMDINPKSIDALTKIKDIVKQYILENTKIDESQGQTIDGLSNIINIPGVISSIKKKSSIPSIKPNRGTRLGKPIKPPKPKPNPNPDPNPPEPDPVHHRHRIRHGKTDESSDQIIYDDFKTEPTFMKNSTGYTVVFEVNENIPKADLVINSVNSEGKADNSISNYIESINYNGQRKKCDDGKITNIKFTKDTITTIDIRLKKDITYQLSASIYVRKENADD